MNDWSVRPLDACYAAVFIDAIVVKIRDGQVANRPIYAAIGVTVDGERGDGRQVRATLAEYWCDLAAELTAIDPEAEAARLGSPVTRAMLAHVNQARDHLTARAEQIRMRRAPLANRREKVEAALAEVRARIETPPPAPETWRRLARPGPEAAAGAPLWRLVKPVEGLGGDRLARLEAALAASGLLDAWVTADGGLSTVDGALVADIQRRIGAGRLDRSVLSVLEPDTSGGVDAGVVRRLLTAPTTSGATIQPCRPSPCTTWPASHTYPVSTSCRTCGAAAS